MRLLRTAAHASVAARVAGNVSRRQQQADAARAAQAAPQQPVPAQAAPTPTGPAQDDLDRREKAILQLTQLGQLRDSGVLTEAEFETQKQRILATM